MKAKKSLVNLITALISQLITILFGFIVPRLIIGNYGSEVNGFISMVNQIYVYIALLEAGLGGATLQALYKPVANNDRKNISAIINATKIYYKKVAICYAVAIVVISFFLPIVTNSAISSFEMSIYFLLFGISNIINFLFTASIRPLLLAEGRGYISNVITTIFHIVLQFVKIVVLNLGMGIVTIQAIYSSINILQILVYYCYYRKRYNWIDKEEKPNISALSQRRAFMIQQICQLLFSCTDVILISIFCDLNTASVYSIYALIFNTLGTMLSMITTSVQFVLGQTYNEDKEKYVKYHKSYELAIITIAAVVYASATVMCIPFLRLYIEDISDVNYIDEYLPVWFGVIGFLSTYKAASEQLVDISLHTKYMIPSSLTEASLNLILSVTLIMVLGIKGALIGTCVALIYRIVFLTGFVYKRILSWVSPIRTITMYVVDLIALALLLPTHVSKYIVVESYFSFVIQGIGVSLLIAVIYICINFLINFDTSKCLIAAMKDKIMKMNNT